MASPIDDLMDMTHNKGIPYYGQRNMPNITLNVEEEVIKKVRKIAIDRNTTLTAMVREYLHSVAAGTRRRGARTCYQQSQTRLR